MILPVTGLATYFAALYEIGHIVGRGRSKPPLECEANAWVYAIRTANWPPTVVVRELIKDALGSYGGTIPFRKDGTFSSRSPSGRPTASPVLVTAADRALDAEAQR